MKAYFDALCKAFVQGDVVEAYQVFAECLSEYHERVVMEDYSYLSDFSAYINPEKKTSIVKFNEDGAAFRAKCDDSNEFNPMAGVAIAFMKGALGYTNSQEFRKRLEDKMVDTSKKSVLDKDVKNTQNTNETKETNETPTKELKKKSTATNTKKKRTTKKTA